MALVLRVRTLFRGTWDSDNISPNSMCQQLISRGSLWVKGLGKPPELLQSAASETEVILCPRGRAQFQREHSRWDSVVEEPSSICLHLSKRRAASPVELSITLQRGQHPTPTGWVLCVPQVQTPQCQEVLVPPAEQRQLPCSGSWQAACPLRRHRVAHQHPAFLGFSALQEESSCRLHCKTMRGQLLGYSWDKQLLLQLPQAFAAKPCQGQLHLLSSSPQLHRPCRGGTSCVEGSSARAVSGFSLIFPLRGASTAGSEDSQQFQYLLWGRTVLSLLHRCQGHHKPMLTKSKSSCRASSEVPEMSQERSWAQEDSIATQSPSLFPNP